MLLIDFMCPYLSNNVCVCLFLWMFKLLYRKRFALRYLYIEVLIYAYHLVHWKLSLQHCAIIVCCNILPPVYCYILNVLCIMKLNNTKLLQRFIGMSTLLTAGQPKHMQIYMMICMTCTGTPFALNVSYSCTELQWK